MMKVPRLGPRATLLTLAMLLPLAARAQVSANVACPKGGAGIYKSITAALAAYPPSMGPLTITASGTCRENVDLSRLSGVTINGSPMVTITPKIASATTIVAGGTLSLNAVSVTAGSAGLGIYGLAGSNLTLTSSSITGAGSGTSQPNGGTLSLFNSVVQNTGGSKAIYLAGGVLQLNAANGGSVSIIGGNTGIGCEHCHISLETDSTGTLSISNNPGSAIFCIDCVIDTYGVHAPVTISDNGTSGSEWALDLRGGFATLINVNVNNNGGFGGIGAGQGANVEIGGSSVQNNSPVGINASDGGIVHFVAYDGSGVTTVQGNPTNFGCYQGGHQYADTASTITPAPAPSSCLQIGGP